MNHELFREQILCRYFQAKSSNQKYSKRAFAKRMGISHSALIEIMNGKRQVSRKMALRLCQHLSLKPKQIEMIIGEVI